MLDGAKSKETRFGMLSPPSEDLGKVLHLFLVHWKLSRFF